MKRFSPQHVAECARRFAASDRANMWSLFTGDLRRALIDAHVMDEMRIADCADSEVTFTATQLMFFRGAVEAALAEGVKKNSRAMKCSFRIDD